MNNQLKGAQKKAEWLKYCLDIGWDKSDLDALAEIWDRYYDESGNRRERPVSPLPSKEVEQQIENLKVALEKETGFARMNFKVYQDSLDRAETLTLCLKTVRQLLLDNDTHTAKEAVSNIDYALQSLPSTEVQDDWVKVEGSNVAQNEWLLVYNGHWTGVAKFNKEKDAEYPEPEWQDENGEYLTPYPTHYMPLPLPPGSQNRIPYSIEAELKRHSDTWDASFDAVYKDKNGLIAQRHSSKGDYIQSLTDKLKQP